jgi:hypothetical protein
MSSRKFPWGKGLSPRKADNLTVIYDPIVKINVGVTTSHNPMGSPRHVAGMASSYKGYGRKRHSPVWTEVSEANREAVFILKFEVGIIYKAE